MISKIFKGLKKWQPLYVIEANAVENSIASLIKSARMSGLHIVIAFGYKLKGVDKPHRISSFIDGDEMVLREAIIDLIKNNEGAREVIENALYDIDND